MKWVWLITLCFLSITSEARGPAVDNFVGVEPQNYDRNRLPSSEKPYNFEKGPISLKEYQQINTKNPSAESMALTMFGIICLPLAMWFLLFRQLKAKNHSSIDNVVEFKPDDQEENKKAS